MSTPKRPAPSLPCPELIDRFAAIVGEAHAVREPADMGRYLTEWRDQFFGRAAAVLRPGSAQEVAAIVRLANDTGTGLVPQGGNTGLVGGQIPDESGTQLVVSLERMSRIRGIDPDGWSMEVEAGVTLLEAQQAADRAGRLFALSLPSEGSARIGGNLATNAGGVNVLAYGNARAQVLGLEVVLPDGRIWNGLRALKKDNTGYDLKDLFVGSEGTLGIITAAVLRLFPRMSERATAFAAFPEIAQALPLFSLTLEHGGPRLTAFEIMSRRTLEMVLAHVEGARDPLVTPHPWYALIELSGRRPDGGAAACLEGLLAAALERGLIEDASIAASLSQSRDFWLLRERVSEAQKPEGGSLKHDISVPVPHIPEFVVKADALIEQLCPGARPVVMGHFGDGNIHYNVSQPVGADRARFMAEGRALTAAVHALVVSLGGSISAEHGIGRMKREMLAEVKSEVELDLMRRIKAALDPKGIMNPGKVL
jgi:FAD/FMN-containing dehydrogenase